MDMLKFTRFFSMVAILQKIFFDTTRLLAKKTNNLLDEPWNFVEDGKLVQTAVLLLAAQDQIRRGASSNKRKGFP
jgi:hypothetical protein